MTDAPIQIRNPDVVRDIRELAQRTGLALTDAVADAVRRRLAEESGRVAAQRTTVKRKVAEIVAAFRDLPKTGRPPSDADLYDKDGFPR